MSQNSAAKPDADIVEQLVHKLGISPKKACLAVNTVYRNIGKTLIHDADEIRDAACADLSSDESMQNKNTAEAVMIHISSRKIPVSGAAQNLEIIDEQETISEADLEELVDCFKECAGEIKKKLAVTNQKLDILIKDREEFWQEIEKIDKEIDKYAHNR